MGPVASERQVQVNAPAGLPKGSGVRSKEFTRLLTVYLAFLLIFPLLELRLQLLYPLLVGVLQDVNDVLWEWWGGVSLPQPLPAQAQAQGRLRPSGTSSEDLPVATPLPGPAT